VPISEGGPDAGELLHRAGSPVPFTLPNLVEPSL
jgi:hypothetical protein